ncbi:MAG: META domain-containing protein, partial [Anaerolineales bacterium]
DSPKINKELEMKIFRVIAVLSVLTIIVSACSPGNPADQIDLEGTSWLLTAFNLNNPIEGSQVTMTFNEGLVTGNAGCNSYSSAYQVDGETIAFGPIVQTEMACMEPTGVMEQERDFLEILGAAQSIELADGCKPDQPHRRISANTTYKLFRTTGGIQGISGFTNRDYHLHSR